MLTLRTIAVITALVATLSFPAQGQEQRWQSINVSIVTLHREGRISEAIEVAMEALKVAEITFGPNHPNMAASLNTLALLYHSQGKYAEAEPLYKRALAITRSGPRADPSSCGFVSEQSGGPVQGTGQVR